MDNNFKRQLSLCITEECERKPYNNSVHYSPVIHKRSKKSHNRIIKFLDRFFIEVFVFILFLILCWGLHLDTVYKMAGEVYKVNGNEIYLVDERGEVFVYEDNKDANSIHVGQKCTITLDHMTTESNCKDDIIVTVKYK